MSNSRSEGEADYVSMTDAARHDPETAQAVAELDRLAWMLDSRWRIPGTSIRFGVDAVAGLLPGIGDAGAGLVSAYIVLQASKHGAGGGVIARMLGNVLLDTVVGSVPILGSIFDVYYKANNRNVRLLQRHLEARGSARAGQAR